MNARPSSPVPNPAEYSAWRLLPLLMALPILAAGLAVNAAEDGATVDVTIEGLRDELRKNVREHLSIARPLPEGGLTEGRVRTLHARARDEIRQALAPFGYYRPVIEDELQALDAGWQARYRIEAGAPIPLTTVDIQLLGPAADDPEFQRLLTMLPLKTGDPLRHDHYEQAKRRLLDHAREYGYFDAGFRRQELRIDLARYTAEVVLHLDSGQRYRFGTVRFQQADGLNPALLARFVSFKPGEPYRASTVLALQAALSDSDYYRRVDVLPQPAAAEDLQVPIDVQLTPHKPDKYTLGFGYGTDTGVRGKLGWERRLINDEGHRFGVAIDVSQIRNAFNARYTIPVGDPRTDRLLYEATWTDDHPETSTSRAGTVGASYLHARGSWRETLSLKYHQEDFETGTESGRSSLIIPGIDWLRVVADDRIAPRRGWRLGFGLRGAAEALASDVSFLQARINGKLIWPLASGSRLLARADAGATTVSRFEDLPATLRFYAGGDVSVRGYAYNDLGPRDATGQVIGGQYLTVASLELEQRLAGRWSAALFYDSGRAFSESSEPFSSGAGIGLRWQSPIGPVRIDVASALSEPKRPFRLHVVIGPDL